MTALALDPHRGALGIPSVRAFASAEPRFFALAVLLALSMLPTGFAALVDDRLFNGIDVWDKPLKFEFALVVYLLTLVLFAYLLPAGTTARRWYRIYGGAVVAAMAAEMVWIGIAAGLGTASHFNESPIGALVYPLMGAGAVLLTTASTVYAWRIARNGDPRIAPVLKESIVVGLALVLPLTLVTAGTMSALGSHWVGGAGSDAGGLAFLGWSRNGGDLRVAHLFSTHALHFLPAFGLFSMFAFGRDNRLPLRLFTVLFVAFVAFVFVQALQGRPFLPWL